MYIHIYKDESNITYQFGFHSEEIFTIMIYIANVVESSDKGNAGKLVN